MTSAVAPQAVIPSKLTLPAHRDAYRGSRGRVQGVEARSPARARKDPETHRTSAARQCRRARHDRRRRLRKPCARDGQRRHDRGGTARFLRRIGDGNERQHHSDGPGCGEFFGARADGRGLTCSIWTNDINTAHRTALAVEAGYVWVNEVANHFLGAPFGGWKQSGIGREECFGELMSFTQEKNIHIRLKPAAG